MGHKPQQGEQSLRQSWLNGPRQRWLCKQEGHSRIVWCGTGCVLSAVWSNVKVRWCSGYGDGTEKTSPPTRKLPVIRYRPTRFLDHPQPAIPQTTFWTIASMTPALSLLSSAGWWEKINRVLLQNKRRTKDSPSRERSVKNAPCANWDNSSMKGTPSLAGNLNVGGQTHTGALSP